MSTVRFYKIGNSKISKCKIDQWMDIEIKFTYYKILFLSVQFYAFKYICRVMQLSQEPNFRTFPSHPN